MSGEDEPIASERRNPENEEHEKLVGRTIAGKFVIEKFLGGGAMGAVFLARQTALDKNVAVKVMHARLATDKAFAARFQREAKAASRLDHTNSVRVIDFGEEPDGLLYLAMEYLEGRNLYDVIHQDWPISKERVVDLLSQALSALAVAHDMGVIHRDLKPENMMIVLGKNDDGEIADVVKVCDFGIAKITEARKTMSDTIPDPGKPTGGKALTTQGMVVGTPEYMSPEQAKGEALDARADLYSIGIILYQLLVGRVPFQADSAIGIVLKQVMEEPKPPSEIFAEVDRPLEAVCLKAIRKNKDERYQTARDLRADLRAALEGQGPTTSRMPTSRAHLKGTLPMPPSSLGTAPTVAGMASASSAAASGNQRNTSAPPPQSIPVIVSSPSKVTPLGTEVLSQRPSEVKKSAWTVPLLLLGAIAAGGVGAALGRDGILKLLAPKPPHLSVVGDMTDGGLVIKNVNGTDITVAPPVMSSLPVAPKPGTTITIDPTKGWGSVQKVTHDAPKAVPAPPDSVPPPPPTSLLLDPPQVPQMPAIATASAPIVPPPPPPASVVVPGAHAPTP